MKQVLGPNGGAHNPRTGKMIFPGVNPFSGLTGLFPGSNATDSHILYIGSLFYNNLSWPWQTYNFDSDQAALDALPMSTALRTIDPDLSAFAAHGGKLVPELGWHRAEADDHRPRRRRPHLDQLDSVLAVRGRQSR